MLPNRIKLRATQEPNHRIRSGWRWLLWFIYDKSLKSDVMNTAQKLIIKQYPHINGLEPTVLVQYFDEATNRWHYYVWEKFKPSNPPSAQIHHTGKGHWMLSYTSEDCLAVITIDSMRSTRESISHSLQIQLATVYGHNSSMLKITMPFVQQQRNSVDGV